MFKCKLLSFLLLFSLTFTCFSKTLPQIIEPLPTPGISKIEYGIKDTNLAPIPDKSAAKLRIGCRPAWYKQVDPLVEPGNPHSAHMHVGFGNDSITENSDLGNLISVGKSSCVGGTAVRSAGWVPVIISNLRVLPVKRNLMYYFSGYGDKAFNNMNPIPNGLRMLAGSANNTDLNSSLFTKKNAIYGCMNQDQTVTAVSYGRIPLCTSGQFLRIILSFPNCWDGVNLDSPDHKSHVSYSKPGNPTVNECDLAHKIRIMQVSFNVDIDVPVGTDTSTWWLSSDDMEVGIPGVSIHGDWVNADDEYFISLVVRNLLSNPTPSTDAGGRLGPDPKTGQLKLLYQP